MKNQKTICIIGSGAGAGPVIHTLALAGHRVIVLEKGPFLKTADYSKDEIAMTRRNVITPSLKDEPYVIESMNKSGDWVGKSNEFGGTNFWNGNVVGGSSNFMSGYFHRMKENDFSLLSTYGPIEGANVVDWPIKYSDLEPYYEKVERIVGVSGKIVPHQFQEKRSTPDFPYPPLAENHVASLIDKATEALSIESIPLPRAILSLPKDKRSSCYYSNFCGSYGCSSDAKGSSRAALIQTAIESGNCEIIDYAKVFKLETNGQQKIVKAHYHRFGEADQFIEADIFVVAAQAIESARLLLLSKNPEFPNGLANNSGQVGKNLIFSAGGVGSGILNYEDFSKEEAEKISQPGLFVNRTVHHFYEYEQQGKKLKGGAIDFLFEHANPIGRALRNRWSKSKDLVYGEYFKQKVITYFTKMKKLKFEIFIDWQPNDNCFVALDDNVTDKYGDPVARLRLQHHQHDIEVGKYLAKQGEAILKEMGCIAIGSNIGTKPPPNLQAGGCRFGTDPSKSVLDVNCKAHEVKNLYVTDGSFMPTGGSVTYTWTIYANAFRVADAILKTLN